MRRWQRIVRGSLCLTIWGLAPLAAQSPAPSLRSAVDSARHLLERVTWGPRPGDIAEVARLGPLPWLDRQLARVAPPLPTTHQLPATEWWQLYQSQLAATRAGPLAEKRPPSAATLSQRLDHYLAITVQRVIQGEAPVLEVLADFWGNHFNVFLRKGAVRGVIVPYHETALRPHLAGRFETLLLATARSPAMLLYLDNAQSVAPPARGARAAPAPPRGLNENYARELLELHTLGVDGGYTQDDVIAVARILTGWGIDRATGAFRFTPNLHDRGPKQVLGVTFPAGGGEEEGIRLLQLLARHPATMHHVSQRLCARFVADDPPDGCVDDAVAAWRAHDGHLGAILRAIVQSPDFWASQTVLAKGRTPLGFVAAAIRALGGTVDTTPRVARQIARLGQPLFEHLDPDGYPESLAEWVNSGALLARMNFAVALAAGRVPGVMAPLNELTPTTRSRDQLVARLDTVLLGGRMSPNTRTVILQELAESPSPAAQRALAVGLILGSPEFQRR